MLACSPQKLARGIRWTARHSLARPAIEWKKGKGEESEEERVWKWGKKMLTTTVFSLNSAWVVDFAR